MCNCKWESFMNGKSKKFSPWHHKPVNSLRLFGNGSINKILFHFQIIQLIENHFKWKY